MDVNVRQAVTDGLRLRGVEVLTAQEDGSRELEDDALLDIERPNWGTLYSSIGNSNAILALSPRGQNSRKSPEAIPSPAAAGPGAGAASMCGGRLRYGSQEGLARHSAAWTGGSGWGSRASRVLRGRGSWDGPLRKAGGFSMRRRSVEKCVGCLCSFLVDILMARALGITGENLSDDRWQNAKIGGQ